MCLLPFIIHRNPDIAIFNLAKNNQGGAFKLAAAQDDGKAVSVVSFMQAKAIVLRIIKRDRPVVLAE